MPHMAYRWIEDITAFRAIAPEWDRLADRLAGDHPFALSDFVITWWHHYQAGRQLRILALYQDEALVGGLPLYCRRGGARQGFARVLSYIGDGAANYTEPLCSVAEDWPRVSQALAARRDWDALHLHNVRGDSQAMRAYRASRLNGPLSHYTIHDHDNWAIDLRAGKAVYVATRSRKMCRDLRSKRRHAERQYGPVHLCRVERDADIASAFDLYVRFSRESFTRRGRASAFHDARYQGFFRAWLMQMHHRQHLETHRLMAGETILAVSFGYRRGPGFNWVLTAYNAACHYVRPGYLLIEELIDETLRTERTWYNWYGYDRFYKSQWCNERTPLLQLVMLNRTAAGAGYRGVHLVGRMVKQCFRRT